MKRNRDGFQPNPKDQESKIEVKVIKLDREFVEAQLGWDK